MIKDVETAVRIYYSCPELGTKEIMELFSCSHATAIRLKAPVRELQKEVDLLSKELRETDETIQGLNWTTELIGM